MPTIIKITNRQLIKLYEGLKGLDGFRKSKDEFIFFTYDAKTRYAIARNLSAVEGAAEYYDKAQNKERQSRSMLAGEQVTDNNRSRAFELLNAIEAIKDLEVELDGIFKLSAKALLTNPIPPSTLKDLIPILADEEL